MSPLTTFPTVVTCHTAIRKENKLRKITRTTWPQRLDARPWSPASVLPACLLPVPRMSRVRAGSASEGRGGEVQKGSSPGGADDVTSPCSLSARAILSWMTWGGAWGRRETAVFRDSLNWVWMTHFECSFIKNSGDAFSHQTLPGALRCVPTGLMSSHKAASYLQGSWGQPRFP